MSRSTNAALKRLIDLVASAVGLAVLSPVLVVSIVVVWLGDRRSPFYLAQRAGRGGKQFTMYKMRTMRVGADKTGVTSTSAHDSRITSTGAFLRRYKLDEVPQLANVLVGSMSLVGPRPQVLSAVDGYTADERRLLTVRPGITDYASIVFADEGEILAPYADADEAYDVLIRPGKSALGLHYVDKATVLDDLRIILWTVKGMAGREAVLAQVSARLAASGAPAWVVDVARRAAPLVDARLTPGQPSTVD